MQIANLILLTFSFNEFSTIAYRLCTSLFTTITELITVAVSLGSVPFEKYSNNFLMVSTTIFGISFVLQWFRNYLLIHFMCTLITIERIFSFSQSIWTLFRLFVTCALQTLHMLLLVNCAEFWLLRSYTSLHLFNKKKHNKFTTKLQINTP